MKKTILIFGILLTSFLLVGCLTKVTFKYDEYIKSEVASGTQVSKKTLIKFEVNTEKLQQESKKLVDVKLNNKTLTEEKLNEYKTKGFVIEENTNIKVSFEQLYKLTNTYEYLEITPNKTLFSKDETITLKVKDEFKNKIRKITINEELSFTDFTNDITFKITKDSAINVNLISFFTVTNNTELLNISPVKTEYAEDETITISFKDQNNKYKVLKITVNEQEFTDFSKDITVKVNANLVIKTVLKEVEDKTKTKNTEHPIKLPLKHHIIPNNENLFYVRKTDQVTEEEFGALYIVKPGKYTIVAYDENKVLNITYNVDYKISKLSIETIHKTDNFLKPNSITNRVVGYQNNFIPKFVIAGITHNIENLRKGIFDQPEIINVLAENHNFNYELYEGNTLLNFDDYAEVVMDNTVLHNVIKFKKAAKDKTFVVKAKITVNNEENTAEETIIVQEGFNAYEDFQLRALFRDHLNVEYIHLQRNIKATIHEDQYTTHKGRKVYRNNTVPEDILNNPYAAGSIYYRKFSEGSKRVVFNGNYFELDGSITPRIDWVKSGNFHETLPDVINGLIGLAGQLGKSEQTAIIRNVKLLGNTGLPGVSGSDDDTEITKEAGGLHGIFSEEPRVETENSVFTNFVIGIYVRRTELKASYVNANQNWAYSIIFSNSPDIKNDWTSEQKMTLENSKLLRSGGPAIQVIDWHRALRGAETLNGDGVEGTLEQLGFQKYYYDPVVIINNVTINNLTSPENNWFKKSGINSSAFLNPLEAAVGPLGYTFYKLDGTIQKVSFPLLLTNSYIFDNISDPNSYSNHDRPQWDLTIDGKKLNRPDKYKLKNPIVNITQTGGVLIPYGFDMNAALDAKLTTPTYHPEITDPILRMQKAYADSFVEGYVPNLTPNKLYSNYMEFLPYQRSTDNANFPGEIILEMFKK